MASAIKGPGEAQKHDGSGLRIGIVHARWNMQIIAPLLEGAKNKLREAGVKEENIVVQSVPGSWYAAPIHYSYSCHPSSYPISHLSSLIGKLVLEI
jgi:6,7-dimethyl-8-ribityllumazine synthase